jgi:hypothetical protein
MKNRLLSLLLVAASTAAFASPILTLDPANGQRSGAPGTTVGWGFTIENDTSFYLVVTSVVPTGFDPATGSFNDYVASVNFTAVAPNSNYSEAFNSSIPTGFGEFLILNTATIGAITGADFEVLYDLLVNDPNGPLGSDGGDLYGNFFNNTSGQVTVTDASTAAVPEPATLSLLLAAAPALLLLRRKRRQ